MEADLERDARDQRIVDLFAHRFTLVTRMKRLDEREDDDGVIELLNRTGLAGGSRLWKQGWSLQPTQCDSESYRLHDAKARTRRPRNQGSLAKNDASQAD